MKKIMIIICLTVLFTSSYSGVKNLTHHSRANCVGFNESVSWELGRNWWLWVNSEHINVNTGRVIHALASGWQLTWRNAMFHFPEGHSMDWKVKGSHYMLQSNGKPFIAAEEYISDCSIYDGWWDH